MVVGFEQLSLDQLPPIRVGGERERSELVRDELVGMRALELLAPKEEQLLKVEVARSAPERAQELEQETLPRKELRRRRRNREGGDGRARLGTHGRSDGTSSDRAAHGAQRLPTRAPLVPLVRAR